MPSATATGSDPCRSPMRSPISSAHSSPGDGPGHRRGEQARRRTRRHRTAARVESERFDGGAEVVRIPVADHAVHVEDQRVNHRAGLLRDRAQQPVDEPPRLVGRELLRELDRLGDHNGDRDVGFVQQLVCRHAQDRAIDRWHALERPALWRARRAARRSSVRSSSTPHAERDRVRIRPDGERVDDLATARSACSPLRTAARAPARAPPGGLARSPRISRYARVMYSPERVSTFSLSPVLTNSGHLHDEPGLERRRLARAGHPVALDARFGLANLELHRGGKLDTDDLVAVQLQHDRRAVDDVVRRLTERTRTDLALVVRRVVHEDEVAAVAVQVLHVALVDDRLLDLLRGAKRAVDHRARARVLQSRADERAALAGLDVLEVDHGEQALGKVEGHAVLQVVGGDGHVRRSRSFDACVRGRQPSAVTTTVSSMRTPPCSGRYTPGSTVTT